VVGNLLDNARQHAAPGTPVTVIVDDGDGRIRTSVHNDNGGAPISEANLPRIWERFFTTRAQQGGTGLGLPIVKSVVAAHGGTVAVENAPGGGARFRLSLNGAAFRGSLSS
jgi:signal transduction histidine kinase